RSRPSGNPRRGEAPRLARHTTRVERSLRGHQRVRALSGAQRYAHSKVLPSRIERGTAAAASGAFGRTIEELEVPGWGPGGTRSMGRLHEGLRAGAVEHEHEARALVH